MGFTRVPWPRGKVRTAPCSSFQTMSARELTASKIIIKAKVQIQFRFRHLIRRLSVKIVKIAFIKK